jgi:hypothetical protein
MLTLVNGWSGLRHMLKRSTRLSARSRLLHERVNSHRARCIAPRGVCGSLCGSRAKIDRPSSVLKLLLFNALAWRFATEQRIGNPNAHHFWWALK